MLGRNGYPKLSQFARQTAWQSGKRYYKGMPCAKGHDGTRYVSSGNCVYCMRLRRSKEYWAAKVARLNTPKVTT